MLNLSPLLLREQALKGDLSAPHQLDPSDNLELLLDHTVTLVRQLVSARMAAAAAIEKSLEAQFDTAPEADWDFLKLSAFFVFLFRLVKLFLIENLFVAFIIRNVLVFVNQVSVVTDIADRCLVLEDDDQE